jgi:MFS family permease
VPRTATHHLQLPFVTFKKSNNLILLYLIRFSRAISNKFAFFFLPLFLFDLGQKTDFFLFNNLTGFQKGIAAITGFYIVSRFFVFLFAIPVAKIIIKIGLARAFVFGYLLYAVIVVLFATAGFNYWFVLLAALIDGVQINLFWNSYHTVLSRNSHKAKVGKELGVLQVFINLITLISPAIGGVVIITMGYQVLFMAGLLMVLVGIICSLLMKTKKIVDQVSWREFGDWMKEKSFKKLSLSFFGRYINDAVLTVWPLYVLFLLGSVDRVGFLYSFSLFLAMIVSFFAGSFLDKNHKNKKPFFLSGGMLSFLWLLRTQILSIWTIAVIDMFEKLTSNFHWLFFDRIWILRSKGSQALSYFIYREMIISLSGVLFWSMFGLLLIFTSFAWNGLFIFAGVGVLLSLLVKERYNADKS